MRTIILILLFSLTNMLASQTNKDSVVNASQKNIVNKDVMTIANQHGIKLKKIETIMTKDKFKQSCMPTIPKVVGTADVSFINSKVGKISSCFYLKSLRNDTLKAIYIKTDNKTNTDELIMQTTKQYGQTKITGDSLKFEYHWDINQNGFNSQANLTIENKTNGVLTVTLK